LPRTKNLGFFRIQVDLSPFPRLTPNEEDLNKAIDFIFQEMIIVYGSLNCLN
jgi:hypothetical protein